MLELAAEEAEHVEEGQDPGENSPRGIRSVARPEVQVAVGLESRAERGAARVDEGRLDVGLGLEIPTRAKGEISPSPRGVPH